MCMRDLASNHFIYTGDSSNCFIHVKTFIKSWNKAGLLNFHVDFWYVV